MNEVILRRGPAPCLEGGRVLCDTIIIRSASGLIEFSNVVNNGTNSKGRLCSLTLENEEKTPGRKRAEKETD